MGLRIAAALLVAALVLPVAGRGWSQEVGTAPPPAPAQVEGKTPLLATGATAPVFRLVDTGGATFAYGEEGSRTPLLLVFFSMFCEPCRAELSIVQRIRGEFGKGVLAVAAVCLDGKALQTTVAGFAQQDGYSFPVLLDEVDGRGMFRTADAYHVTRIPTLYLMDAAGRIVFAETGRVEADEIERAVRAVLGK